MIAPETGDAEAAVMPVTSVPTLRALVRAWLLRVRSGDSGVLPVVLGLAIATVVFQLISPHHVFISAGNLVNLFQQSAVFMVLACAEIFALVLGEIDLSAGYCAAIGGAVGVQLVQPSTLNWPWWAAIAGALLACAVFGFVNGTLITRLHLPSFIVTLGALLWGEGLMLVILGLGPFSGYPTLFGTSANVSVLNNLMWGTIDPLISWIGLGVLVLVFGAVFWRRDSRRRRSGLVAPPVSLTLIKIGVAAGAGATVVAICSLNRANLGTLDGVPWVIPIVLGVVAVWTVVLQRTRFGRYVYAVGGNPEAARRAGVNLARVRTAAFVLCSVTAGIAGLLYASYLGGMSNNVDGGRLVLYAVASAVIGGTSLFGGRGRPMHGILGGLVIGAIYNGLYLLDLLAQWQYVITGAVLALAVTVDSLSRRGATTGSVTHV